MVQISLPFSQILTIWQKFVRSRAQMHLDTRQPFGKQKEEHISKLIRTYIRIVLIADNLFILWQYNTLSFLPRLPDVCSLF